MKLLVSEDDLGCGGPLDAVVVGAVFRRALGATTDGATGAARLRVIRDTEAERYED